MLMSAILLAAPTISSVGSSAPGGSPKLVQEVQITTDQLCDGTGRDHAPVLARARDLLAFYDGSAPSKVTCVGA